MRCFITIVIALVTLLALVGGIAAGCATPPCSISEECPSGETCVVGADGARCMPAPLTPPEASAPRIEPSPSASPSPRGRIVLVEATTSPLVPLSTGGAWSLRPLAFVVRP